MDVEQLRDQVLKLTKLGIALSSNHDIDDLLRMIVREARHFTSADAGSLYLLKKDRLYFAISQNSTIRDRLGADGERALFSPFSLPISTKSIAGYVAVTKKSLNIKDVYNLPEHTPYKFNSEFDERNDYRTRSVLTVPMLDHRSNVLGVLQLINAKHNGEVVEFDPQIEDLVQSMASQAAVAVNNAMLTSEIKRVHLDTIMRLSVAAEYKDKDTARHIQRVSRYSEALARQLGWSKEKQELILYAAPMHDVGKIGIADAILLKPGRLNDQERRAMQEHTTIGASIMSGSESPVLQMSEKVALYHHEKWDGTGYPRGLKGEDIPQVGRILAVADVFDALSSKRVYKGAMSLDETMNILHKDSGSHFDPGCVEAFEKILDEIIDIKEKFSDDPEIG